MFSLNKMMKRGQVTVFIILGIVILVAIALVYSLRNLVGIGIEPQRFLSLRLEPLRDDVNRCIDKEARDALYLIGKQGGTLDPIKYKFYNGNNVNYLCYNIVGDERCSNHIVLVTDMVKELNNYLQSKLSDCINIKGISKKLFYNINVGKLSVDTRILANDVLVKVNLPITLSKGESTLSISDFSKTVNIPLGSLYDTVYDIVDSETSTGEFLQLPYMLAKRGSVEVNVDKPYPDKIYILNKKNDNYIFQFAIEGE